MTTTTAPRIDYAHLAGAPLAALVRLEERITLDSTVRELVKLRVSIINGCAFCIDMHWTEAREAGESELRLAQLSAWAESPYFDERERAALALADAMTLIADAGVPADVWDRAARQFDEDELAHLMFAIGAINFWNRLSITAQNPPASYVPTAE